MQALYEIKKKKKKAKDRILGILMHESLAEKEAASEGGKGRARNRPTLPRSR